MLSEFFIDRPKFAFVISIVIALAGLIAIQAIPVAEYPEIAPPQVTVQASYPGANAAVVRDTVAAPIEAQVNGVDDMLYMSSTSSNDGSYNLTVTFAVGTDPDIAAVNVQNRVAIANAQLPAEVTRQGVTTQKQSSSMLMVVNLLSPKQTHDALFLSNYASIHLQDVLSRINGVGSVSQFGALDYGMRVWLDPQRLTSLQLATSDVTDAISGQNIQATAGQIGAPPFTGKSQFEYAIQAKGRLASVEEFGNIIVRARPDGSFIRLRDIARIELGSQTYSAVSKLNNQAAASVVIYQSPGANALGVADQVYAELARLSQRFPPDMEYKILYDTTKSVRASVREVIETLFITFVLVVGVTFLFLGSWRSTIIPALAIPVSLIGTFAVLFVVGFSANMITLFAVILAIGVVVDDSIVVVENVQRIMTESGKDARAAAVQAMREVTGPVVATTLVLFAVFVPVSFMPGITGELYRQFSVTICVAVAISSVNALTLSPALCALLLRPGDTGTRGLLALFSRLVATTREGYVWLVELMIRRILVSLAAFAAIVAATVVLFQNVPTGFVPLDDRGVFFVNVQLPEGAALSRTEKVVDRASDMLLSIDGVDDVISVTGFSLFGGTASNAALVIPVLADWDDRTAPERQWHVLMAEANRRLATLIEANAFAFPVPPISGLGTGGAIEAQLQDLEGRPPQALAAALRGLVFNANQEPALRDVFSAYSANVPQLFLDVDRDKAEVLGVSIAEIFATLQANLGSSYINDFSLYGKVYRVIVQAEAEDRDAIDDIGKLHVRNANGDMIPLRALVDVRPILGPLTITRYNQLQSAALTASNELGFSTGQAIGALESVAANSLPAGYAIEWTGTTQQELEAGGVVVVIFGLALLFAYLFLVAQYESWTTPVAVILPVVIAAFGALLPLAMLPFLDNNLYAQIGMVMLIGLASKNAILIVEFAKLRRDEGLPAHEAAVIAARLRFRAVMMTAMSFIFGVLPLVFATGAGAASRVSIGVVVFGGMLAATAIGILFIPLVYVAVQRVRGKVRSVLGIEPSSSTVQAD